MRRRPPRRVLRTAVAVVLVSMPVGACSIPESNAPAPRNVTITALTPEQAEEAVGQGGYSSPHTEPMPTESGWVQVFDELPADGRTGASLIISRDENEAVQWAVNTDRPAASSDVLEKTHAPQARTDSMGNNLLTMTNYVYGYAISDPSGARMSLILAPDETDGDTPDETDRDAPDETDRDTPDETGYNAAKNAKEDEDSNAAIAEQRSHVLVLDTATGETVRVVEVDGMVLGQALTSDELVVETAQRYFPGDSGQGALHVFSLTDPAAEPLTLPTDKWVVGSGASSVLLSQRPPADRCLRTACGPTTLTVLGTDGTELTTVTGVDGLLDSRNIRRFTDPAAAVALTLNENALPRREWEAAWDGLEVEIIPFDDVAP
ncbi:hypothetical protein [Actinomyces sp. oral taxon 448]|uniref:hypothetical protein n=1 Tax=Actinomyces sp. oral taxon 448 TaxID=712124 RepID=UPI0025BE7C6F|nr:hypothetical protein [Actinomyces sp. oral taxon 448]